MIEQGLFKNHQIGKDGFNWWIGQIAPEESWKENIPGVPVETNEDESYKGFGERCRVRIIGAQTHEKSEVSDEELPWATVMYPVTAGGGGRGSYQSMNLVGGNFVFGFYIDGDDAQQPVIMGAIGYNDYQEVMKQAGDTGFIPHSGWNQEQEGNEVPYYSIKEGGSGMTAAQEFAFGAKNNDLIIESTQGSNSLKEMSSKKMEEKGKIEEPMAKNEDCEPVPTNRIQKQMQNVMHEMESVQRSAYDIREAISSGTSDIQGKIAGLQAKLAKFVSSIMKSIFSQIEKTVLKALNDAVKPTQNLLMPNERPILKTAMDTANDLIACLFKKIFGQLLDMVMGFLSDALGTGGSGGSGEGQKVINVPTCYVNDFIGSAIGSVSNEIDSELSGITSNLNGILDGMSAASSAAGGLSSAADGAAGALGSIGDMGGFDIGSIIQDLFSFLGCEEENKCPTVDTWSMWYGMDSGNSNSMSNMASIGSKSKSKSSKNKNVGDGFKDMSFDDIYSESTCGNNRSGNNGGGSGNNGGGGSGNNGGGSTGGNNNNIGNSTPGYDWGNGGTIDPITCGPPLVRITGGWNAKGNAIVSQSGKVLSVDITDLGVNYDSYKSRIIVIDQCGKGNNAVLIPIIDEVTVTSNDDGTLNLNHGGMNTTMRGARMSSGNLGYEDSRGTLIPILNKDGAPVKEGDVTNSVVDGIIIKPGTGYLPSPDGSLGGDKREWARPDDTIIRKPGGGWLTPVPPGNDIDLEPGDTVTTPGSSNPVYAEPGEQLINPGVPTIIENTSTITAPPRRPDAGISAEYPTNSEGAYPVVLYLCEIVILNPGFNYSPNDEIVISPNSGAVAVPKFDKQGRVLSIKVTKGGEGFTDIPYIYIKSQTGYNAKLVPKFCIDRVSDALSEPKSQDKLVTVIDCVSRSPVGYLNGKPYYGPYHEHKGVRMVGYKHTSAKHATLTARP
tara:strand:- start:1626 stop:4472 length:2847 start_codon:yes stop_codon:yes gene_type:complete